MTEFYFPVKLATLSDIMAFNFQIIEAEICHYHVNCSFNLRLFFFSFTLTALRTEITIK